MHAPIPPRPDHDANHQPQALMVTRRPKRMTYVAGRARSWSPAAQRMTYVAGRARSWSPAAARMTHITGGRPALVIRHAVLTEIGWRRPGSIRQPSANPDSHARSALADLTRISVIASQSSR